MTEQLASLLLPIDALLGHKDFAINREPSSTLVTLFRNMWFLCVLFQFTAADGKDHAAMAWQKPALARIAVKTPTIVLESAHDSIASDLEYNPVIRKEFVETVRAQGFVYLFHISIDSLPGHRKTSKFASTTYTIAVY